MVTASHNPAGWNGIKLGTALSKTLLPDEVKELYRIIEAEEYANGTAGLFVPQLLRDSGCEVVEHYTNVDLTYPHYTANSDGQVMMEDTGAQVRANGCDIGLAFDGDGDRLGVTDETGATVWPDRYIALLARLVLEKQPGAKIVFDVKVSEALPEDITAHGGNPIMWKTGHSYIKR